MFGRDLVSAVRCWLPVLALWVPVAAIWVDAAILAFVVLAVVVVGCLVDLLTRARCEARVEVLSKGHVGPVLRVRRGLSGDLVVPVDRDHWDATVAAPWGPQVVRLQGDDKATVRVGDEVILAWWQGLLGGLVGWRVDLEVGRIAEDREVSPGTPIGGLTFSESTSEE